MSCAAPVDVSAFQPAAPSTAADPVQQSELCRTATLRDQPTHDLRVALQREHCAPRVVTVAFCAALSSAAALPPCAAAADAHVQQARAAGRAVFERMWALQQKVRTSVDEGQYVKGDRTHRMQLRLWQALCVLAPLSAVERQPELLQDMVAALQRFDLASVKQYQERSARSRTSRLPHACAHGWSSPRPTYGCPCLYVYHALSANAQRPLILVQNDSRCMCSSALAAAAAARPRPGCSPPCRARLRL